MNILIVDDEVYVAEGIGVSMDWRALGIENAYTAYSMKQAQRIFKERSVDILLCDIEMPKGSGLDLLTWVREQGFKTVCIFLTSHAVFDYANRAIHLESADYILKPIPYDKLSKNLEKAVQKVREQQRQKEKSLFAEYWSNSQRRLLEQFWLRVSQGLISPEAKKIAREAASFHLDIRVEGLRYCPVLIQLKPVREEAKEWEASLLEFALKNVLAEMLFSEDETPAIPRLGENLYLAVICRTPEEENREKLIRRCKQAIASCCSALPYSVTCYMDRFVPAVQIAAETRRLLSVKDNNILYTNTVCFSSEEARNTAYYELPPLTQWIAGIFSGELNSAYEDICGYLDKLAANKIADRRLMTRLYHDFLQGIYSFLNQKGVQAHMLFQDFEAEYLSERSTCSIEDMKAWILRIAEKALGFTQYVERNISVIINVQRYIREHLNEELSRADISARVFLTPDYLSHIFKEKTGMSLTDFIAAERMGEAKKLLRTTNLPIRDVSLEVGYPSIPYFSKLFKRFTGKTPLEYRKQRG